MKLNYTVFLFFLLTSYIRAQQVKVLSKVTEEPISGVVIYNVDKSKSVISNLNGEASLTKFSSDEILYFQHLTHMLKKLEKAQIEKVNVVYLEVITQDLNEIVISASNFEQQERDIPQKIIGGHCNNAIVDGRNKYLLFIFDGGSRSASIDLEYLSQDYDYSYLGLDG